MGTTVGPDAGQVIAQETARIRRLRSNEARLRIDVDRHRAALASAEALLEATRADLVRAGALLVSAATGLPSHVYVLDDEGCVVASAARGESLHVGLIVPGARPDVFRRADPIAEASPPRPSEAAAPDPDELEAAVDDDADLPDQRPAPFVPSFAPGTSTQAVDDEDIPF